MKNLTTSSFLFLLSFSLFGQINYSLGMGSMVSFGNLDREIRGMSKPAFSYFVNGQVSYSKSILKYNLGLEWNQTILKQEFYKNIGITSILNSYSTNINYLLLNPSIEIKPIKSLGINFGLYEALKIGETFLIEETIVNSSSEIITTKKTDFGLTTGFSIYFNNRITFSLRYLQGLNNISNTETLEIGRNSINIFSMKNQSLQLGGSYILK